MTSAAVTSGDISIGGPCKVVWQETNAEKHSTRECNNPFISNTIAFVFLKWLGNNFWGKILLLSVSRAMDYYFDGTTKSVIVTWS